MIRRIVFAAVALALLGALSAPAEARSHRDRVAVGTLECRSPGTISLIVAFTYYDCDFFSRTGKAYQYRGRVISLGLQAGVTAHEVLVWRVYAPTTEIDRRALRGGYAGAHAGAAVVVGLGANVLVGGSDRTVMLQPLSVEAKTGINFAVAGTTLMLY